MGATFWAVAMIAASVIWVPSSAFEAADFGLIVAIFIAELAAVRFPSAGLRFSLTLPLGAALALRTHPALAACVESLIVVFAAWRLSQQLGMRVDGGRLTLNLAAVLGVTGLAGTCAALTSTQSFAEAATFVMVALAANALFIRFVHRRLDSFARSPLDQLGWLVGLTAFALYGALSVGAAWFLLEGAWLQGAAMLVPILLLGFAVHLHAEMQAQYQETMVALTLMLQRAHPYTHGHLERVARLSEEVGLRLGMPAQRARMVRDAAILHDIGKIAIDEQVLEKPGRLTEEEFAHVKNHAEFGGQILKDCPQFAVIASWIHSHHERPDGNGYPEGRKRAEIPLESRIIAVADAFDAMVGGVAPGEKRGYREPMDIDSALNELDRCAGTQFDVDVVRAFREVIESEANS
jgi:hypothetical protein